MKHKKSITKLNTVIVLLFGLSFSLFAQSPLEGTWENVDQQVKLEIQNDRTGSFSTTTKMFLFNGPCTISNSVDGSFDLEFKITVGGENRTVYAIVRQQSVSQIKFISFLSKEEKDTASNEIKDSGITLTKSN